MDVTSLGDALFKKLEPHLKLTQNKKNVRLFNSPFSASKMAEHVPTAMVECGVIFPLGDELYEKLRHYFVDRLRSARPQDLTDEYKDYSIGFDVLSGQKHVLKDGAILPLDFNIWKERVPEEQYELLYAMGQDMVVAFNPHKPLSWLEDIPTPSGYLSVKHFNTYVPAPWQLADAPADYRLVESFIPDFLDHFFPVEEEKQYMKWWLYNLSHSRCQDLIVLVGMQGNGKNTFMTLASIIAGKHNSITASKAFGKEKFNSEIYRRKLVNIDEYTLNDSSRESMKVWANDNFSIEKKGQDPIYIENHCSFIIANNYDENIKLDYKDRRFTVPTLADTDMLNVWNVSRLKDFKNVLLHSEEFAIAFPHWIQKVAREEKLEERFGDYLVLKTPRFYELTEKSKPKWWFTFKRLLKVKESVTTRDIYKKTRTTVSEDKVIDRLKNEKSEREYRNITPTEIAKPVHDEEGDIFFESLVQTTDDEPPKVDTPTSNSESRSVVI